MAIIESTIGPGSELHRQPRWHAAADFRMRSLEERTARGIGRRKDAFTSAAIAAAERCGWANPGSPFIELSPDGYMFDIPDPVKSFPAAEDRRHRFVSGVRCMVSATIQV